MYEIGTSALQHQSPLAYLSEHGVKPMSSNGRSNSHYHVRSRTKKIALSIRNRMTRNKKKKSTDFDVMNFLNTLRECKVTTGANEFFQDEELTAEQIAGKNTL